MQETLYRFMIRSFKVLGFIPDTAKELNLQGETASQYKTRLYKRSGELYGMLHNRPKDNPAPMSKEEILREMAENQKLKDQLFEIEKRRQGLWRKAS